MNLSNMLASMDSLLMKGQMNKDVILSEALTVTIRVLKHGELIQVKESIPKSAKDDIFLYSQIEALEMMARAITHVNGVNVVDAAKEEVKDNEKPEIVARLSLYKFISGIPTIFSNKLVEEYNELVNDQNQLIEKGFGDNIENFSSPISEE